MNMASSATKNQGSLESKRAYRMTARADAAAATGERLLAAAWRHFSTQPYEQVRLHEIAVEANVTQATLHTRFGSKDELFTAAYAWFGAQEMATRNTAPVGDARAAIRVLFDRYEAHGRAILRMLAQEERIPQVHAMTDIGRRYHQEWAQRTFEPSIRGLGGAARRRRLTAIVLATDLLVWKLLRLKMEIERGEAERVVLGMVGP
jgi:AcrR family transcriptional regulator